MLMMFWSISFTSSIETTNKITILLEILLEVVRVKLVLDFGLDRRLDFKATDLLPVN